MKPRIGALYGELLIPPLENLNIQLVCEFFIPL
jgi:hypothetical protein